jgi:hypothetical protein
LLESPTTTLVGDTDVSTGVGLSIANAMEADAAAPGFATAISAVPPALRLEAGITAESEVALA